MQSEYVALTMADAGPFDGAYDVDYIATYQVNGTTRYSNTGGASYDLTQAPGALSPISANITSGIPSMAQLKIVEAPIYTSLAAGGSAMVQLEIGNPTRSAETANLSVEGSLAKAFSLSASSVYLGANSSALVNLLLRAPPALPNGTYAVPLTISVTSANASVWSERVLLTFSTYNETQLPNTYDRIQLINSSQISATVAVVNPTNTTLRNVLLYDYFPGNMIADASQISTSGMRANVSRQGTVYRIEWDVGTLVPHLTAYGYYRISNPSNLGMLFKRSSLMVVPLTQAAQGSILRINNITLSAFYVNSTGALNISMLYTGTSPQRILLLVSAPQGITAINQQQTVNATPNQLLTQRLFMQAGTTTGTFIITLYIQTANANYTYYLPLVVLANPQSSNGIAPRQSKESANNGIDMGPRALEYVAPFIFLIIVLAIMMYALMRRTSAARYDRMRAEQLKRIRDSMDREAE
jgi:hypothetical protein